MRKASVLFVLAALFLLVRGDANAGGVRITSAVGCRTVDGFATSVRSYVIDITTGTDSLSGVLRESFNLPTIGDTTQIAFVTDSTACTLAAKAHALAEQRDTVAPPPVYLLGVGSTRY